MIVEGNPKERSPLYLKRAKFPLGEDKSALKEWCQENKDEAKRSVGMLRS